MTQKITFNEQYGKSYRGELEFIIKSTRTGKVIDRIYEPNLVKIFAKEILSHRLPPTKIWDADGGTGDGAWVASGLDPDEDFSPKYILFGASFDDDGAPLDTNDSRFYEQDLVTSSYVPISLGTGAEYDGGLINAVPIAEPGRPLKRVERVYYESSYQPAGTPLLQDDVRAMNNIVVFETTLRGDEYNGPGLTSSDYYTVTEVALAAGKELDSVGACECTPANLFLEGRSDGTAVSGNLSGSSATLSVTDGDAAYVDVVKEGDQIKLVDPNETAQDSSSLDLVSPYFLVVSKEVGGSDIVLDRTPTDSNGDPLTGTVGFFRSTLRIFSHRVLVTPFKKSSDFEVLVRWRIILN